MRFKVVPEPADDVARIEAVQRAVPLVPDEETSCCARLMKRADVPSQDSAKEWLTFLRALGLVEVDEGRYRRLRGEIDPVDLRERFVGRVYLAEEVLEQVADADEPIDAEAVFARLRDCLPQWERLRHTDPESVWRERVERILEWAVAVDLLARVDGDRDRYRSVERDTGEV